MRSRFDEQLMLLNKEMIEMGALCEDAIELVAKALETNNGDIYKEVRPISVEIDHKERDIEAAAGSQRLETDFCSTENDNRYGTYRRSGRRYC